MSNSLNDDCLRLSLKLLQIFNLLNNYFVYKDLDYYLYFPILIYYWLFYPISSLELYNHLRIYLIIYFGSLSYFGRVK